MQQFDFNLLQQITAVEQGGGAKVKEFVSLYKPACQKMMQSSAHQTLSTHVTLQWWQVEKLGEEQQTRGEERLPALTAK